MMEHFDSLTHWLFAVKELAADQLAGAVDHLSKCVDCSDSQFDFARLDVCLHELALASSISAMADDGFDPADPFRRRPSLTLRPPALRMNPTDILEAQTATERAAEQSRALLESLKAADDVETALCQMTLNRAQDRFALLYMLQEAGRQSAANPIVTRALAEKTIDWLRQQMSRTREPELAEVLVPRMLLRAQAHLLLAITLLWMKEFSRARPHLIVAYRSFARAGSDETSFALVEFVESQRRSLSGEGRTALILARRARETFESCGMDDYAARATVTEGLAHYALDDHDAAVRAYRSALPIFESQRLWSNYVGALNSAATSLTRLGRFDEARREYARALRRFSHASHRYLLGYLRIGFAEVLFAANRYAEAARAASSAASTFEKVGQRAHQLIALLLEVECWARGGSLERARQRLDLFRSEVEREQALDPAVQKELIAALSGTNPDYQIISTLRRRIDGLLEGRDRPARA